MAKAPRVLIIGGAVAGASCAITLRKSGVDVTVVEKETFPRPKVCGYCLGGSGIKQLNRLRVCKQVSGHCLGPKCHMVRLEFRSLHESLAGHPIRLRSTSRARTTRFCQARS